MKTTTTTLLASALLAAFSTTAGAATVLLADDYNVTGTGLGFNLNTGLNSGINPPTATRLTGTLAPGLRYFKAEGGRANNLHYITNSAKFATSFGGNNSLVSFNDGTGLVNFGSALNVTAASASAPAVYELTIDIGNYTATGTGRASFGISSSTGIPQAWDFGIELYRVSDSDTAYTIQKRIDVKSNGGQADTAAMLANNIGAFGQEVSFLMRVTDAGPESGTTDFNSRVELAIIQGSATNWIYDTRTDSVDLPLGWRFSGANRYIYFYVGGDTGPVTFDNFSLNALSIPTAPEVRTWTGAGGDNNWSTGANWGGTAPNNGDWLIFGAATRQANNNDLTVLTPWLTFDKGGFVLGGNEFKPLAAITNLAGNNVLDFAVRWQGTSGKSWHIAPGTELTLNGPVMIDLNGDHTFTGGGTLRATKSFLVGSESTANPPFVIADGRMVVDGSAATFSTRGGLRIGAAAVNNAIASEVIVTNGAVVNLTLPGAACRVGNNNNGVVNRLIVDNSTFNFSGGDFGVPWVAGVTGEVVQVGSSISDCKLTFNMAGGDAVGTYSIKDGVLVPRSIARKPGGTCSMIFDNATLRTAASFESAFMAALDLAEIRAGGLTLDIISGDVTLSSPFSGAGGLKKTGPFGAVLTGVNSYAGTTVVQEGRLVLPTTHTSTAAIQVADGAQIGVNVTQPGTTLTAGSLAFAGGTPSLDFDLGTFPTPTAPIAQVGTLAISGPVTVNVSGGSMAMTPGTITLMKYSTLNGSPAFTLGTIPSHITATLQANAGSLDLVITGVKGYRWTGAVDENWDYATMNWVYTLDNTPSAFADGFAAVFPNNATRGAVTLQTTFTPALMVVDNSSLAYTLNGGGLTTAQLKKSGSGSLTRIDGLYDLIGEIELNEGTYVGSYSLDTEMSARLTDTSAGLGTFVKEGSAVLTMATNNSTYDGAILVQQGTLRLGTNSVKALGSTNGATTIASGASLDVANVQAVGEPVIVSGAGVNGQGAIVNNTLGGGVQNNLTDVTMVGDTTFGSIAGTRWDIRIRSSTGTGPGLRANGFNLTKVGGGSLAISSQRHNYGEGVEVPYWEMNIGDLLVSEGNLAIEESVSLGNPGKAFVVNAGASVNFFSLGYTNPILRTIQVTDASITCGGSATHTNVLNGNIVMAGNISMRPNNACLIVNGQMSGTASLTIGANPGPGVVLLNGANTFTGDLMVTNSTLGGDGSIAGSLVMAGGNLAPGAAVGTFTVNGSATLAGETIMELAPGAAQNSDKLVVNGTLTGGGVLNVVLTGASAPVPGEVFQLFNKPVSGFTAVNLPDISGFPGGLTWDQSGLAVDGTIKIVGSLPPSIGTVSVSGGTFTFSGTGGTEGATYYVLTSTDVAAPISSWVPVATNTFTAGGAFSFSMSASTQGQAYFRLQIP